MTIEEAIKHGKEQLEIFGGTHREFIEMAIKALEQEPFKPMVEIDLYSVIKQKYIERDVLDKIRAEIEARSCDVVSDYTDGYRTAIQGDLAVIDKYRAESGGQAASV